MVSCPLRDGVKFSSVLLCFEGDGNVVGDSQ